MRSQSSSYLLWDVSASTGNLEIKLSRRSRPVQRDSMFVFPRFCQRQWRESRLGNTRITKRDWWQTCLTSCRYLSSMSARDILRIPDKHRICQNLGLSSTGPFQPLMAVRGVILFSKSGLNCDQRQISPFIKRWTPGGAFVLKDDTRPLTKWTQYVRFTQELAI